VEGSFTLERKTSPVNVTLAPTEENPVMDEMLPVAVRELTEKKTTFGSPNACAIVCCGTNRDHKAYLLFICGSRLHGSGTPWR
jgi:hypothetical protein